METPQEERYWSRFASSYDRDGEYVVGGRILEAITLKLSQEQPLGRTVEFGCGTGYFTVAIAGNARQVVATDLSDTMLETARARLRECTNVTIRQAGCAGTSFAPGSFDSVVMINLLHVIEDPSRCLQESHRILRKGGTLIAADLTGHGMKIVHKLMLGLRV